MRSRALLRRRRTGRVAPSVQPVSREHAHAYDMRPYSAHRARRSHARSLRRQSPSRPKARETKARAKTMKGRGWSLPTRRRKLATSRDKSLTEATAAQRVKPEAPRRRISRQSVANASLLTRLQVFFREFPMTRPRRCLKVGGIGASRG